MKKYKLEQFLGDTEADFGTGLLVTRGFGFCFTVKQPDRWGKTKEGFSLLPFGGIGGKLEKDELPADSLHREAIEEVGSDVKIIEHGNEAFVMDADSIQKIFLTTDLPNESLPVIVFRSPRAESGRKPFTNIFIYAGRFISSGIKPIDDPAIIEMDGKLLLRMAEKSISVKEFKQIGGKITSRIELPDNGMLFPVGTAIAVVRCLKEGVITPLIFEL